MRLSDDRKCNHLTCFLGTSEFCSCVLDHICSNELQGRLILSWYACVRNIVCGSNCTGCVLYIMCIGFMPHCLRFHISTFNRSSVRFSFFPFNKVLITFIYNVSRSFIIQTKNCSNLFHGYFSKL